MATFITSKSIGQTVDVGAITTTGYWKYNHNGSDSGAFNSDQSITVLNANGEFTIISCLSNGTTSGSITYLVLSNNQIVSFDGTGLSNLTYLNLNANLLTSFNGAGLSNLETLTLGSNLLTTFSPTGLSSLINLVLFDNLLTTFTGTGLTGLSSLNLSSNLLLTSINLSGLNTLQYLDLASSPSINTTSVNNLMLSLLATNELNNDWNYGLFYTTGGRTPDGTTDFNYLVSQGWDIQGANLFVASSVYPTAYTGGVTISGFVNIGNIAIDVTGNGDLTLGNFVGGISSEYDNNGYIIISDTTTSGLVGRSTGGGIGTASINTPTFWASSTKDDVGFVNLVNKLPARSGETPFSSATNSLIWLNANGYWTSYGL